MLVYSERHCCKIGTRCNKLRCSSLILKWIESIYLVLFSPSLSQLVFTLAFFLVLGFKLSFDAALEPATRHLSFPACPPALFHFTKIHIMMTGILILQDFRSLSQHVSIHPMPRRVARTREPWLMRRWGMKLWNFLPEPRISLSLSLRRSNDDDDEVWEVSGHDLTER